MKKNIQIFILFLLILSVKPSVAMETSPSLVHQSGVTSLALSPDGKWLLAGSFDWTVKLANFPSGNNVRLLFDRRDQPYDEYSEIAPPDVMAVAFSPDGTLAAAGIRNRTIRIWNLGDEDTPIVLQEYTGMLAIAFSPDSSLLASGGHGSIVHLWNTQTGKPVFELDGHNIESRSLAFTSDGQSLVTTSYDGHVRFWNVSTGQLEKKVDLECGRIYGLALSQHASVLAAGCRGGKILTSSNGFEDHQTLAIHWGGDISSLALSADGKLLVSGGGDDFIRLWDVETGKELRRYAGHRDGARSVVLDEAQRFILSGGNKPSIQILDLDTGERVRVW